MKRTTERLRGWVEAEMERAADLLRQGGTVAFPTETVYGLGANALDGAAVEAVFRAKERPGWDPLIVHVAEAEMLRRVAVLTEGLQGRTERLMEAFWPGPLTLLLPRTPEIPETVTAGRPLVGVRMPRHPVALDLIRRAGVPVAAPSANRFGRTSPTTAGHVLEDLDGRIDAVLDGGPTEVGVESTVLDATAWPMVLYRPGAVTAGMIERVCGVGSVRVYVPEVKAGGDEVVPESLPSPGVGLRHYAPRARLVLVAVGEWAAGMTAAVSEGEVVGVMLPEGWEAGAGAEVYAWGDWGDAEMLARRLFNGLRVLDTRGVAVFGCPVPEGGGLRDALRDRLQKAARVG